MRRLKKMKKWPTARWMSVCTAASLDAIRVKIRDEGFVRNKAVYIALGIAGWYEGVLGAHGRKSTR